VSLDFFLEQNQGKNPWHWVENLKIKFIQGFRPFIWGLVEAVVIVIILGVNNYASTNLKTLFNKVVLFVQLFSISIIINTLIALKFYSFSYSI